MAGTPEVSAEERKRQHQLQLDALVAKTAFAKTDAAVETAATIGSYAALCAHVLLVALGAWLLTRGGSARGPSFSSQFGAVVVLSDAIFCCVFLPTMVRASIRNRAARAALVLCAALVALTALPTVYVSAFGEVASLPFRHILFVGRGGLWMLALLGICAVYGAGSVWLAWRLGTDPARLLRALVGKEELV